MRAICLNCTLKRSPEESSAASLSDVVMSALRDEGEWPQIRERILAAEILVVATPTWLGQPLSVSKRALERMDAFLSETYDDGATPIAFSRVAGVVVVGNEDGAHHCISEISGALIDIGYTIPGQAWTYWNKGPGPGEEEWLTTDEREWSITTGQTAARNLLAVARAQQAHPIPPPPSG